MVSPGAVDRWIALELGRMNAGLVVERKTLATLLAEPQPVCRTREGDPHPFDPAALRRLADVLTREETESLRLPITVLATGDLEDSAYVSEELAAKTLRAVEGFGPAFPYRGGRMYLPHSLAVDLVRHSGGTLQLAFG
ncbi:MAG TPA: DUF61 family protein [Thermoplasmata archaeon]|nr:DUF61 family protein [Thermoplasmata archaeon]